MTKRIIGLAVAAVLVLGLGGAALAAASPGQPSVTLEESALALAAADPAPPGGPPAKREELRACVKAKVDGGAKRKEAGRECATQLGVTPGRGARAARAAKKLGLGRAAHAELVVPKKGVEGQWETVMVDRGTVTAASADSLTLQRPDGPTVTVRVVAATRVKGAASVADLAPGRVVVVVSAGGEARSVMARP